VVSSLQGRAPPLPPPFRRLCMDTAENPLLPVRCYGLEMGRRYRSSAVAAADECGQCHVVSVRSCWTRTSFMCKCTGSLCLLLRPKSQTLVWYQSPWPNKYTKCLKPHFRSIVQSHWQMQKFFFAFSVRGSYTALSCDVTHNVFVLFAFASVKVQVIWFESER